MDRKQVNIKKSRVCGGLSKVNHTYVVHISCPTRLGLSLAQPKPADTSREVFGAVTLDGRIKTVC
jgi:hypothetical protein